MAHQQHQQKVPGGNGYPTQQSQQQMINQPFTQQQISHQQQILNQQSQFAQQRYDVLQQYYSQIGSTNQTIVPPPIGQPAAHIQQMNIYPGIDQQNLSLHHSIGNTVPAFQPNPLLFSQQQSQSSSSAVPYVPNPSVCELASLAAQHHHYLLQQQQQYINQQQQQTAYIQNPQQQQQQHVASMQNPSSNTHILPTEPSYVQNPKQTQPMQQQLPQAEHKVRQDKSTAAKMMEHTLQQQQRTKTPEDARLILAQKDEAQAKRKAEENEKESRIVHEELKRKQFNAKEYAQSIKDRIESIPDLNFAGCHTLSKVSVFLPFPMEMVSPSSASLPCFDPHQTKLVLSNENTLLADYIGTLLSDTTDQLRHIQMKQDEKELDDFKKTLPEFPLIQTVQSVSQFAFSDEVDPASFDMDEAGIYLNIEDTNELTKDLKDESGIAAEQESTIQLGEYSEQDEMRRQIISVGKQPKGVTSKKKKDMVESLYDSLSDYFSTGQRNRSSIDKMKQSGTDEEDQASTTSNEKNSIDDEDTGVKRGRKRRRNSFDDHDEPKQVRGQRSQTPTEIIKQREFQWNERQKQNEEKCKRRQQLQHEDQKFEAWNKDIIAENESFCRFTSLMDQIFDQVDESMSATTSTGEGLGILLERTQINQMRIEAQKLRRWKKLSDISPERLIKLLTIMEKNIRDSLTEEGLLAIPTRRENEDDESDETLQELIEERLLRSVEAAIVAICIMTSKRMPKQIMMEDIIERSIQLCKQCLQDVIYASFDTISRTKSRKNADLNSSNVKRQKNSNTEVYTRLIDLLSYFSELARSQSLNEVLMYQLATLCTSPFFVDNVAEVQMQAIKLLPIVFSKCPALRKAILYDLMNSLHRLPQVRTIRNSYRLNAYESIGNFSVLILQLIQSTVQLPTKKNYHQHNRDSKKALPEELDDRLVLDSFDEAKKLAAFFLGGFLAKCTAKAEDGYRRLFDQFLQDLLVILYRPMWPVAEMMITVLGNLLVVHYRSKTYDLSLRVTSLDYLGIIAARLRKDRIYAHLADASALEKTHLNTVVKSILIDEFPNDPRYNIDDIDINSLSSSDKIRKLEQALFDYIIGTMWDGDVSIEYILLFYAVEWYRDTVLDVEVVKERYVKSLNESNLSQKEKQKCEQKMFRIAEKGQLMKHFIIGLMDKQHIKRRMQTIVKSNNILVESDANWVVKYLASKKELSQSFDIYLRKILEGFNPELYPVAIRAKAMKCLAQIVEADYQVLMIPEVNKIVQDRLIDANASVREATFDLIGKCLVSKPSLLETYYTILINRTKDTAVAVRKRVIRILRDIILLDQQNDKLERKSQVLSEIMQRVNDEEGVKKLCLETFQHIWMQPTHDKAKLDTKISLLIGTAQYSITEGSIDHFDTLISLLIQKTQDHNTLIAARQIVDAMVDYILSLERNTVGRNQMTDSEMVDSTKNYQAKLFATLTTLSFFAKARPELLIRHIEVFVPYLSVTNSSNMDSRFLNQIITMMEQIIPLVDNLSDLLIRQLDSRLNEIAKDGGMLLISNAISCMSVIHNKFHYEEQPAICKLFIIYYKYLNKCRREMEMAELNPDKKPNLLRSLYSIGLMCRYFDFDLILNPSQFKLLQTSYAVTNGSEDYSNEENQAQKNQMKTSIFSLLFYFSRCGDQTISQNALIALGQLTAGNPELLRKEELKSMYMVLLSTDKRIYLQLKVQVLKNIACFLHAEEQRAMKRAEQAKQERDKQLKQQEDYSLMIDSPSEQSNTEGDDLKEMESNSSGLSSSVIQQYWNAILNSYFSIEEMVRINSTQVIRQTLEQGLVTPGSSIPTLIAMSTDPLAVIRSRIEHLIRDMNTKYKGLIQSKAVPGVRLAFQLQKKIRSDLNKAIRGIRFNDNPLNDDQTTSKDEKKVPKYSTDAQALLSNFYINLRTNRQNRRSFLSSLLKHFSEEHKEKIESEEWIFLADNLAHFPYSVMDEPLYIIHQANSIISISGQNILSQFRQLLVPEESRPNVSISKSSFDTTPTKKIAIRSTSASTNVTDELEEFSVEYILDHLPDDRTLIYELKRNSQACFILLHLKTYLMRMYGLKDDKILEYSPSEAANIYEKPIIRRNIPVFSPDFVLCELALKQHENQIEEEKQKIADDFHKFYEMLLSLDERKDDDDEETSLAYFEDIPAEEKEISS